MNLECLSHGFFPRQSCVKSKNTQVPRVEGRISFPNRRLRQKFLAIFFNAVASANALRTVTSTLYVIEVQTLLHFVTSFVNWATNILIKLLLTLGFGSKIFAFRTTVYRAELLECNHVDEALYQN
ncbi:hypothetical protein [Dulcicalothrix desertica]|uniref:hypothetical protein n=1 Tax=Dulcicalothrix desertica TaxID=32056 RepID=UPI000F8E3F6C|nr:hypothetical protein [Dulcicalothrix desertica]TWH40914.1 hypothetical protein CAL7102_10277 [Dulcicalothrix desertica PCC 7102]